MSEYLLNVDMDCYGPYHSKEQARYAKYVFAKKYPDLAGSCYVCPIVSEADYWHLISPMLLH